ncbi:MAG: VapC toxin family PIN domain ribonuclease [Rhodanobacter sp.]|nr:MAG: VapC toxin family PIN domain ribonuclease [Rhodanobacter sp.]TAM15024.1 MAG: VapC toxin family PIN domain ribonuclease [Rhodanobacter sp.]TAM36506.1 MAG: VapC toxin family PIN domain ribonuclease [Rhodanobacter sp.]
MGTVTRKAKQGVRDARGEWSNGATTWLLDVNVLLALLDPTHPHHAPAHAWFATARASRASCNLTENGALHNMSHPRYGNAVATTAIAADLLAELCSQPGHVYWPADLSLLDSPLIDRSRLLTSEQVTDTWLLALAVQRGGKLATFDKRLVTSAVQGGDAALQVIA